ncbi:MAG: 4Fe-4S dicluster domain-containing protein [Planctomycetes bacterium]|nr:4Fe-4S dicluster domain-containing protein [Planctomycetota bacterium]
MSHATTSRRDFLCVVAGCTAAAVSGSCGDLTHTDFFRKRFREMGKEELAQLLVELDAHNKKRFGKDVHVGAEDAMPDVEFGYALDINLCTGCRRCVHGCVDENNQDRDMEIQWIRVLEMEKEHGVNFHHADPYYDHETVPHEGKFYLPVACQQCRDAPCVKSCPVEATWQEDDGIVVVDYDWCIGCRCCMASCPYGARRFNWKEPEIPADEVNTDMHYLGNRPRPNGVVEKCTFCIQRARKGQYPKCVEVCPVGARKFGNLLDPNGELRYVLENKQVFILKSELSTRPRFYYYYG